MGEKDGPGRTGRGAPIARGISLSCPLSPLIGTFILDDPDRRVARSGLFYLRFMADVLVLSPMRWKLRRAVRAINGVLGALELEKHRDKTFIGGIERGFDLPGHHFGPEGLAKAARTFEPFVERPLRLYQQEPGELGGSSRLGPYVRRWVKWAEAGLAVANIPVRNGATAGSIPTRPDRRQYGEYETSSLPYTVDTKASKAIRTRKTVGPCGILFVRISDPSYGSIRTPIRTMSIRLSI